MDFVEPALKGESPENDELILKNYARGWAPLLRLFPRKLDFFPVLLVDFDLFFLHLVILVDRHEVANFLGSFYVFLLYFLLQYFGNISIPHCQFVVGFWNLLHIALRSPMMIHRIQNLFYIKSMTDYSFNYAKSFAFQNRSFFHQKTIFHFSSSPDYRK